MGDVVQFKGITKLDIDPNLVVNEIKNERLDSVIVLGYDKDGNEYFASSLADGGDVLWLLERMKIMLLSDQD